MNTSIFPLGAYAHRSFTYGYTDTEDAR